jgi:tripartite-type tricarboxylate transporter receptor subunit TctC
VFAGAARAQDCPNRSITVIVPFPAGGPSDVVARIVTDQMSKTLGESMVIENVGGAGGVIGSGRVATATADGYTLLASSMGSHIPHTSNRTGPEHRSLLVLNFERGFLITTS